MTVTLSAHDVARELRRRQPRMGVVKLHKLLYYCQGWHTAWFGEPLFHESIEAWANGPVVAALWRDEKHGDAAPPAAQELGGAELGTVEYVLGRYGRLTGRQLIDLTHQEQPWRDKSESVDDAYDDRIEPAVIGAFLRDDEEARRLGTIFAIASTDPRFVETLAAARGGTTHATDEPDEIANRLHQLARR